MKKQWTKLLLGTFLLFATCAQADLLSERIEKYWTNFKYSIPGSALAANKLECEGLTLKNFKLDTGKKYTIVSPGDTVTVEMDYEIHADQVKNFNLQHYVYGLHSEGPIDCLAHNMGLINRQGHMKISFKAPKKKGIYQLRVLRTDQNFPINKAAIRWENASSESTIAIIAVD